MRRGDEQGHRAVTAQAREVELGGENVAQRVEVERVELFRAEVVGPLQHQLEAGRQARVAARRKGCAGGDRSPESRQCLPGAVAAAGHQAVPKA